MDSLAVAIVLAIIFVWASFHALVRPGRKKLPPGPYPFPIIGNILQLGSNPPESLTNLSKIYGPLMSFQLGRVYTVVVSSPEVAKQVLQEHDQALSSRAIPAAIQVHDFPENSLSLLPVGSKWRKTRKIFREHLFLTRRLNQSEGLRQQKLTKLHEYLQECASEGRVVSVNEAVFTTILNLISFTLFSVDFASFDTDKEDHVARDLLEAVLGVVKSFTAQNIADPFPILNSIDPQGIRRQSKFCVGKLLKKIEEITNSRLESRGSSVDSSDKNDLLEALVNIMEDKDYNLSIKDIKYLFLDLFLGATHTTTTTVEAIMKKLLFNPDKMAKAKNEIRTVIGKNNRIQESDISRLPYLQAVIKEVLRLNPPGPFLLPRKADYDVEINGYIIPKNAQIFVNIWAIGRDPSIWQNPTSFEPERFLNNKIDYKGQDFTYIPFGSGRRICPGMTFADRMLPLIVASLIGNFDWKLEPGTETKDVVEKFGVSVPLAAIPTNVK